MATLKQKRVARRIVEALQIDNPPTAGEILEKAGYAPGVVKNPSDILNSQGVRDELAKMGFDEDTAKSVVGEILIGGENDLVKLKAADMVFKTFGTYAPEKSINLNVEVSAEKQKLSTGAITRFLNGH